MNKIVDTKQPACYAVNVVKKNTERGNMKKLIIAAHGYLARGIKSTLEIISGSVDDVIDINAFTEECPSPEPVIRELLARYEDRDIVVLTDLHFGGVNQIFLRERKDRAFPLITGINLPVAMELLHRIGEDVEEEMLEELIGVCRGELKAAKAGPAAWNADEEEIL